ncbi:acetyltransferase (GNAT) family protein [Orbus hercynius]|uniref:Acetyltransferase (GNAT) family protein n=1 Tax=Orbus hercynius TaxID=593135 RepID=A0A495RJB4_9GAMM|nr:GNAT family N-acetyltransferase [Orbus hercynius]RKS87384.1 acetyltransferase (GNAT) family protein [Orbus hercynius]
MQIISIRQQPQWAKRAIDYFQKQWASAESMMVYEDAINRAIDANNPLPQWYILLNDNHIIGCAGLIPNDFISRCELYPWLCALYIDEAYRGQGLGKRLVNHVIRQTQLLGFNQLHLCTDLTGYYEKLGFFDNGLGYHPWGETSNVYSINTPLLS